MKFRRTFVLVAAAVALTGGSTATAQGGTATAPRGTPTATHFSGVRYVGPLFRHGLSQAHGCTATVIRSARHNLAVTAAHCVTGTGAGMQFAPGYVNGTTPHGVWTVTRVWVSPTWIKSHDPHDDYAFVELAAAKNGKRVQDVLGGPVLDVSASNGITVTDVAYPRGINDEPITCTNGIVRTREYPTFDCHGYTSGVSGSPFLLRQRIGLTHVVGLVGGLNEGGCYEWNSFSSPFSSRTMQTYLRAERGERADVVPSPGSDGC